MKSTYARPVIRPEFEAAFVPETKVPAFVEWVNHREEKMRPLRAGIKINLLELTHNDRQHGGVQDASDVVEGVVFERVFIELEDGRVLSVPIAEPVFVNNTLSAGPLLSHPVELLLRVNGETEFAVGGERPLQGLLVEQNYIRLRTTLVLGLHANTGGFKFTTNEGIWVGFQRGSEFQPAYEGTVQLMMALTGAQLIGACVVVKRGESRF